MFDEKYIEQTLADRDRGRRLGFTHEGFDTYAADVAGGMSDEQAFTKFCGNRSLADDDNNYLRRLLRHVEAEPYSTDASVY